MKNQFIVIEGPIGVGKTTLAEHLADEFGAWFLHDTETRNPYLETFYRHPKDVALHTQLHFLISRLEVLQNPAVAHPTQPIVSDFLLDKDRLFAELTLDEHEWWMYTQLYERLAAGCRQPDLVIYLQAPLERLIQRIERRGVRHERRIDSHYLEQLIALYERFFHDYTECPLMIVNTAEINLADNAGDRQQLIDEIRQLEGGRHYFNPIGNPVGNLAGNPDGIPLGKSNGNSRASEQDDLTGAAADQRQRRLSPTT